MSIFAVLQSKNQTSGTERRGTRHDSRDFVPFKKTFELLWTVRSSCRNPRLLHWKHKANFKFGSKESTLVKTVKHPLCRRGCTDLTAANTSCSLSLLLCPNGNLLASQGLEKTDDCNFFSASLTACCLCSFHGSQSCLSSQAFSVFSSLG